MELTLLIKIGRWLIMAQNPFVGRFGVKSLVDLEVEGVSTLKGNVGMEGNLVVSGDLTIEGTTTTLDTQHVLAKDNTITVNSGEAGAGVTSGEAGIEVDRGTEANYKFIFDESDDSFKVGETGTMQKVATREDTPTDSRLSYWDNATNSFKTDRGIMVDATGNIGIGTDTPIEKFDLRGIARFTSSGTGGITLSTNSSNSGLITADNLSPSDPTNGVCEGANFGFNGSASNFYGMGLGATRDNAYDIWLQTGVVNGGGYRFYRGITELFTISKTGSVGIGTTSPSRKLDVLYDGGVTIGEHFIAGFKQAQDDSNLLIGYLADGASVTSALVRVGNNQDLTFGTSNQHTAMVLENAGNLTIVGNLSAEGSISTGSYEIDDISLMSISRNVTGNSLVDIYSYDGDGTDNNGVRVYGVGTKDSHTNNELLYMGYDSTRNDHRILSIASGTGTVRPIHIYTKNNEDQLMVNVDGTVSTGDNLTVKGTLIAGSGGSDNELLRLNAERTHSFFQRGTGGATYVALKPSSSGKRFVIEDDEGTSRLNITPNGVNSIFTLDYDNVVLDNDGNLSVGGITAGNIISQGDTLNLWRKDGDISGSYIELIKGTNSSGNQSAQVKRITESDGSLAGTKYRLQVRSGDGVLSDSLVVQGTNAEIFGNLSVGGTVKTSSSVKITHGTGLNDSSEISFGTSNYIGAKILSKRTNTSNYGNEGNVEFYTQDGSNHTNPTTPTMVLSEDGDLSVGGGFTCGDIENTADIQHNINGKTSLKITSGAIDNFSDASFQINSTGTTSTSTAFGVATGVGKILDLRNNGELLVKNSVKNVSNISIQYTAERTTDGNVVYRAKNTTGDTYFGRNSDGNFAVNDRPDLADSPTFEVDTVNDRIKTKGDDVLYKNQSSWTGASNITLGTGTFIVTSAHNTTAGVSIWLVHIPGTGSSSAVSQLIDGGDSLTIVSNVTGEVTITNSYTKSVSSQRIGGGY